MKPCNSLDQVRAEIDRLDQAIVALLAERGGFVAQAARFKKSEDQVRAPARVEQVIARVRALAQGQGANPEVVEAVYRAMIDAFIRLEMGLSRPGSGHGRALAGHGPQAAFFMCFW